MTAGIADQLPSGIAEVGAVDKFVSGLEQARTAERVPWS
jgi:hypothetical protein